MGNGNIRILTNYAPKPTHNPHETTTTGKGKKGEEEEEEEEAMD
jgi:hypothetical protein